jgi:hypothetical protein
MGQQHRRERLRATWQGKPVDPQPRNFWGLFFVPDSIAAGLAEAMLGFHHTGQTRRTPPPHGEQTS